MGERVSRDGERPGWIGGAERLADRADSWVARRHLAGRWAAAALVLPLTAFVLVLFADAVPDQWVLDNLYRATVSEGLDAESYDRGYAGGLTDGFSECKRLTIGLGDRPGTSAIESAVQSPTLGACGAAVPKIVGWAEGEGLVRSFEYARYWNGSAAVFRPLVATVGVAGTRVVAAIALTVVLYAFWAAFRRRFGAAAAAVFMTPILLTTDVIDLPGALLHALAWVIAFATATWFLVLPSGSSDGVIAWWSFVAGAVFLFFADLANPEAAWALMAASIAFVAVQHSPPVAAARRVAIAAAAWIVGFAWMWSTKWVVAAMVLGFDRMWDDVTGQIEVRIDGEVEGSVPSLFDVYDRILTAWWDVPLTPIVTPALVIAVAVIIRRGRSSLSLPARLVAVAPALIPLVWYAILRNHTYLHFWFVYRSFAVAVAIVAASLVIGRSGPSATSVRPAGDVEAEVGT